MLILSRNCCFHRSRELKILNFIQWSTNHGTLHGSHYNIFSGFLRNLQSHAWPPEGSHWAIQISQNYSPISFQFSKFPVLGLVVGETVSVTAHFKLALFSLYSSVGFYFFWQFFLTFDLFLKANSAIKLFFFAIKWPLIVIASHYFLCFVLENFDVFVKSTHLKICDVIISIVA